MDQTFKDDWTVTLYTLKSKKIILKHTVGHKLAKEFFVFQTFFDEMLLHNTKLQKTGVTVRYILHIWPLTQPDSRQHCVYVTVGGICPLRTFMTGQNPVLLKVKPAKLCAWLTLFLGLKAGLGLGTTSDDVTQLAVIRL